jgi:hypothetical protein
VVGICFVFGRCSFESRQAGRQHCGLFWFANFIQANPGILKGVFRQCSREANLWVLGRSDLTGRASVRLFRPRPPDLTPSDVFLWEFLKERDYSNNPRSLEELKHNTEQTVANTDRETLRKVAQKTLKKDGYLSSRRWWTSTVKLFCKLFLKNKKSARLFCFFDITKAYKYCYS